MGLPVVGMVGGGPLSRMTYQAGIALGLSLRVLADVPHDLTAFASGCEVVTFDPDRVPVEQVAALEALGHKVFPGSVALRQAQDGSAMRDRLAALGVSRADEGVPVGRELVAVVARSPYGQAAAWPVVETVPQDGVCVEVLAPAPGLAGERATQAQELALDLAQSLGVVGILAVELCETDERLVVSGLSLGPHHSGHWSIEGARTSQFEQHLRAVLDYPLGATTLTAPCVVTATVLGGEGEPDLDKRLHLLFGRDPALKVHLYGEEVRPGRPIGHVTTLGDDVVETRDRARLGAHYLRTGTWLPL